MTYDMGQFIQDIVSNNIKLNDEIYEYLCSVDRDRLKELLKRLNKVKAIDAGAIAKSRKDYGSRKVTAKQITGKKSKLVGEIFEQIIQLLFENCQCVTSTTNVRTTVNEIDFLISVGPSGMVVPFFKNVTNHLIGEAKCYTSGVKVEWINELIGIMQAHNTNHSILFLGCNSSPLRTDKIHILQLHCASNRYVVPFGMGQLNQIVQGANFLKVLAEQYTKVLNGENKLAI